MTGDNHISFKNCEIVFNTGLSTALLDCGIGGKLNCDFRDTSVSSLGTPSMLYIVRSRINSQVSLTSSAFYNN